MKKINKMSIMTALIFLLIIFLINHFNIIINAKNSVTFFVANTGDDKNPGTKERPFATVEAARDAIRNLKSKTDTVNVYIRGGAYYRTKSFNLESIDSGTKENPIVYKAYKNEKVIFTGGMTLDNNKFIKVKDSSILNRIIDESAREHIFQYKFKLNEVDYRNINENISDSLELYFNDYPMTMARWPNDEYASTGKIINNKDSQYTFHSNDFRPLLWKNLRDVWLFGYWYQNWADYVVRIQNVDIKNQNITFNEKIPYGIKENQRYFAFNIFEELDKPGEWCLDRTNGIIYIYEPVFMSNGKFKVSQLREPFISFKNASYISVEGINFQISKDTAIVMNNCENITIQGCNISNIAKSAVTINDGNFNGVKSCNIYNIGRSGINITSGDRTTLKSSENYAENNEMYNYGRIKKTYTPAININGVGIRASHNKIHDAPHAAILFEGNDNLIEYNEIYSVATETDDVGAIYSGRDWTFRGNIIRYNYIHNIKNPMGICGKIGVYLDDCMSSAEVYGNVFYELDRAIMIGGGRDNKINNNLIINCTNSIRIDERGPGENLNTLINNLNKVPIYSTVWKKKYPKVSEIMKEPNLGKPSGNNVTKNALYNTLPLSIEQSVIENGIIEENIFLNNLPVTIKNKKIDFTNNIDISNYIKEFKEIPFNKIGIYKCKYQ